MREIVRHPLTRQFCRLILNCSLLGPWLLGISAFAQSTPGPGDSPIQQLKQAVPADTAYLNAHAGAKELSIASGEILFQNKDHSKAAVFGSVSHQDPTTGKWVANAAVLSSTANGWRVDGTANSVFMRQGSSTQHVITQTYTDFATKHAYTLTVTLPSLAYDKNFNFHSVQAGPAWALSIDGAGAFDFSTAVAAKQGAKTYSFPVTSSEALATVASGALSGGAHVSLSRAVMIPKSGKQVACSPWVYAGGSASFTCDDSVFKASQFPYKIDPSTQTLTDGGTYNVDAWSDGAGNYGSDNATITFNPSSVIPANGYYLSSSCGFNVVSQDGPDGVTCGTSAYNPTSMQVQVSIDTSGECDTCSYGDSATVDDVSLTLTWYDPPANVSPGNGATDQPVTAVTLTWSGPATSTCYAGNLGNLPTYNYTLYVSTGNPPTGSPVASGLTMPDNGSGNGTASYTISGLSPGTQYYWQVSANYPIYSNGFCGNSISLYSNTWTFTTALSASEAPTFSPTPGTYTSAQSVTLSTTASGATIRYTLDGSTPSETAGTVYTGPLTISTTTTIKAIAYVNGADSPVSTGLYTLAIPDPRRTGVRPTGSYWGAAGEDIDLNSGNLNLSVPLLQAKSRGSWSVSLALAYNSQFWRGTSGGPVKLIGDVGYGLGWTLSPGSILPSGGYYIYTDSTGAQYRLDQANGNVWTSREGVYVSFDANFNRLYFPDGSFWVMGAQSISPEADAGMLYPTYLQDSNGNYITIQYEPAIGSGSANTSARIAYIADSRASSTSTCLWQWQHNISCTNGVGIFASYVFAYNSDPIPHLIGIQPTVGTPESYSFYYAENQAIIDPFNSTQQGTATLLQTGTISGLNISHSFQYGLGTGELTQYTTPLGGILQWQYRTYSYTGVGYSYREVQTRKMQATSGSPLYQWNLTNDSNPLLHATATISDLGAGTSKVWTFLSTTPYYGFASTYEEHDGSGTLLHKDYGWTTDAASNVYLNSVASTLNPGASYAATSRTVQTLDTYGNLTQSQVYDYGNPNTPARTYTYQYLTDPNYTSRYIFNRLVTANVSTSSGTITLTANWYDDVNTTLQIYTGSSYYNQGFTSCGALQSKTGLSMHDDTNYGTNLTYRGNVTGRYQLGDNRCYAVQTTGVVYNTVNGAGTSTSVTPDPTGSLPSVLTPNGNNNLAVTISYTGSWAVTQVSSPNGATTTTNYDTYGRPLNVTIPDGAVTNYTYTYLPNTQTATMDNRFKTTTLDGFGRITSASSGHDSTTIVSTVDTVYAPCACSPLGKVSQVSQPYAPGTGEVWTSYTYDGSGRTLTVTAPDGSVTHYSYQGNSTTITDPANKSKTYTNDAFGNLIQVQESDPNLGTVYTNYTYNGVNQLIQVVMPRNGYNQTRTFVWTGQDLTSETTPEAGTVTYQYDGAHHVTLRTDAKGQQRKYTYDSYGRLTEVQHYAIVNGSLQEQTNQQWDYYYDYDYIAGGYNNSWGRLAGVAFGNENPNGGEAFAYLYSYSKPGRVTTERFQIAPGGQSPINLDATYAWDNEGRMTSQTYPGDSSGPGPTYTYGFDSMGRPSTMTSTGLCAGQYNPGITCWAGNSSASATWGPANQLLSLNGDTRTYNSLLQLTRVTVPGVMDMQYNYTAGQNNGRITQSIDNITSETVNYGYDSLNRLTSASAGSWGENYGYDGYGNLTAKTPTAGSPPSYSQTFDPSLNAPTGSPLPSAMPGCAAGSYYVCVDVEDRTIYTDNTYTVNGQPSTMWGYSTYDPWGRLVFSAANGLCLGYFYGITGEKQLTLNCNDGTYGGFSYSVASRNEYFAGHLITWNNVQVVTDRLGTIRAAANGDRYTYYSYGEQHTATGTGTLGLYADLISPDRTYDPGSGRFGVPDERHSLDLWLRSLDPGGLRAARRRNPTSWNRYAYSWDDPVNNWDRTGTTCVPQSGDNGQMIWANDGTGCAYSGTVIPPTGSFNVNSTGSSASTTTINYYCLPGYTGSDCSDVSISGWLGLGQQVLQQVGQAMNSISVGGFTFAPMPGTEMPAGSFLSISGYDSNSGSTASILAEVGTKALAVGFEEDTSGNNQDFNVYVGLVPGEDNPVDAGFFGSGVSGTFGFFLGVGDYGFGGYISLGGGGITSPVGPSNLSDDDL